MNNAMIALRPILTLFTLCVALSALQGCYCTGGSAQAADGDGQGEPRSSCAPPQYDEPEYIPPDWDVEATCGSGSQACGCRGEMPMNTSVMNESCESGTEIAVPCFDGLGSPWMCDDGNQAWAFDCSCE